MNVAVYAGTFDPITNGHVDIIQRSLKVFDRVVVAIGENEIKKALFSVEERKELISLVTKKLDNRVSVDSFSGLLVDYVREIGAKVIVRGLRAVSDYEYEAQMATINGQLADDIETVFLMTSANLSFISSSVVKEVARNFGDVSSLVPTIVAERLRQAFEKKK